MAHYRRARFLTNVLKQCSAVQHGTPRRWILCEPRLPPQSGVAKRIVKSGAYADARNLASATPQAHTEPHAPYLYSVHIITGNVRGAGTTANIRLQLMGTLGESDPFVISTRDGFSQGSVEKTVLSVPSDIGGLRMVRVEREETDNTVANESWFLEKILVEDPTGSQLCFPCMQWFGLSACGSIAAPRMRHLLPQSIRTTEWMQTEQHKVKIKASGMVIPHPDKVRQGVRATNKNGRGLGGEDAYFYVFGKNEVFGMGVADGVYAWRERGIDPGRFAYYLMEQAYLNIRMGYDDVFRVLHTAARKMEAEGVYGSSTCCMLTINMNNGRLNSVLLGDSGFIVIGRRDYHPDMHLIFRTPQQEHEFGRPFQLGHHEHASKPTEAIMDNFQVFAGDTIVMGTDGLFDNLFLPVIIQQVDFYRGTGKSPQALVGKLIEMAHDMSIDKHSATPYSHGFTEAFNLSSSGGKKDDITVAVAYIS